MLQDQLALNHQGDKKAHQWLELHRADMFYYKAFADFKLSVLLH